MIRVLICGDRNWTCQITTKIVIDKLIEKYEDLSIIHGGCRGADNLAGRAALDAELTTWIEPAKWAKYSNGAGPIRNQLMLDRYKPHLVIALHADLNNSKGTLHMVNIAIKAGIPYLVVANKDEARALEEKLPEVSHEKNKNR